VLRDAERSPETCVIGAAAAEPTIAEGLMVRTTPRPRPLEEEPSTMVFQAWHSPHWPTHFAFDQPHSVQVNSRFALLDAIVLFRLHQNYQPDETLSRTPKLSV
jgi:hypothetical protein